MNKIELLKATGWGAFVGGAMGWIASTPLAGMASLTMGATALGLHKFCNDPAGPAFDNTAKVVKRTFVGIQMGGGLTGAVVGAVATGSVKVAMYYYARRGKGKV